jgi:hypothetical protein
VQGGSLARSGGLGMAMVGREAHAAAAAPSALILSFSVSIPKSPSSYRSPIAGAG